MTTAKTTAPKAPKTAKTAAPKTQKTVVAKQVETFTTKYCAALEARLTEQHSKDTATALSNAQRDHAALNAVFEKPAFKEIASTLIGNARIADSKQDKGNFIAVKVLVKIGQVLSAIGSGLTSELDPYTRTIAENLIALNGISNKSALVSLSKSIEYDETEQVATLVKRYSCSANTAGTQASSTRMTLKHLGICTVAKAKRGDVITLQENERAQQFAALFVK